MYLSRSNVLGVLNVDTVSHGQIQVRCTVKGKSIMAASRLSGDVFESHLAFVLLLSKIPYDKVKDTRIVELAGRAQNNFSVHLVLLLCKAMKFIERKYGRVKMCWAFTDEHGKQGESGDFGLMFNGKKKLSLSLKRNNHDIKAPRPSALATQLRLSDDLKKEFNDEYARVTKEFYDKNKSYKLFKHVPDDARKGLLKDVTTVCAGYIRQHAREDYFKFLMGSSQTILFEWNGKSDVKSVLHLRLLSLFDTKTARVVRCEQFGCYLLVVYSTGHMFQMRLHTAKDAIQSNVSLKWAVQLKNREEMYASYTFEHLSGMLEKKLKLTG